MSESTLVTLLVAATALGMAGLVALVLVRFVQSIPL